MPKCIPRVFQNCLPKSSSKIVKRLDNFNILIHTSENVYEYIYIVIIILLFYNNFNILYNICNN